TQYSGPDIPFYNLTHLENFPTAMFGYDTRAVFRAKWRKRKTFRVEAPAELDFHNVIHRSVEIDNSLK
ncbi:MAG TPA: hypothetical protein VGN86_16205, partial [Pyrinomonadaceae bacterium]|nr:hypothetical protein [Pyrinomonadaceae bacterium]